MSYVIFEDTKEGRKILGKGKTLHEAKEVWFKHAFVEDPVRALSGLTLTDAKPYDSSRIDRGVLCAKLNSPPSHISIDHDNPRIFWDGDGVDKASCVKAIIDERERRAEWHDMAVRWNEFSQTWYGKLLIKFGLA